MANIRTSDSTELFYKDWGPKTAQPIVFHHRWPLSAHDWDHQMMFFLSHGYRVIAHDRRGHGRSAPTDIGNEMDTYASDVAVLADVIYLQQAVHPARVAKKHDGVTRENGPYMANGSMRTLRAIYNHARKANKSLPPDNLADAVDWNEEERRNSGMGSADLKGWFVQLAALGNRCVDSSTYSLSFAVLGLLRSRRPSRHTSIFGAAHYTSPNQRAARRPSISRRRVR